MSPCKNWGEVDKILGYVEMKRRACYLSVKIQWYMSLMYSHWYAKFKEDKINIPKTSYLFQTDIPPKSY